jgi:hypothetical protein
MTSENVLSTVAFKLSRRKIDDTLKLLHTILFGRRGKVISFCLLFICSCYVIVFLTLSLVIDIEDAEHKYKLG